MKEFKYKSWFVSLDDSAVTVGNKLYKMSKLDPMIEADRIQYKKQMGHIIINDNGRMYMEDLIDQYDMACSKTGGHIPIVVIDYAQMFASKDTGNEYGRLGKLCGIIKNFSKRKKCVVFLLSQAPKGDAG